MATCEQEVSDGVVCGKEATGTIRVRDQITKTTLRVPVCRDHKAAYNRKAAEQRVRQ